MTDDVCYNQTNLSRKLSIADLKAAYDENAKWIFSEKVILAHLLLYTVPEYKGMAPDEVLLLIDGEPQISKVAVNPGETNVPEITGDNTENTVPGEGSVTFDIRFHSWLPGKKAYIKLLIDVEEQNDYFPGYDIVTRGVFYTARMISSQLGTEFTDSDYNKIKKVYSIWICKNVPKYAENTVTEYSMAQKNIVGSFPAGKSRYDLQSVIVIGLSEKLTEETMENKIHRLLGAILSDKLSVEEKKQILENEYQITMTPNMTRRVQDMCNLSDGIEQRGIEKGIEKGIRKGRTMVEISIVRNMMRKNLDINTIADLSGKDVGIIEALYKLISGNQNASDEALTEMYLENS